MATHYKGTASEVRALDALIALNRAAGTLASDLDRCLVPSDLSPSQFGCLEALLHLGPLSPRVLAQKLLHSPSNITTVVDNLERDGLVRRERDSTDRRCVTVHLSPRGLRKIQALFPPHVERVGSLLSVLTAKEQKELKRLCRKLGLGVAGLFMARQKEARQ